MTFPTSFKVLLISAFVAMFPIFGLDLMDQTGFDRLPLFSATKIFQVAWMFLSATCIVAIVALTKYEAFSSKNVSPPEVLFIACALVYLCSLIWNSPADAVAWFRVLENMVYTLLICLVFRLASEYRWGMGVVIGAIALGGMIAAAVVLVALAFFPEYAIAAIGDRVRLGGSLFNAIFLGNLLCVAYLATLALHLMGVVGRAVTIVFSIVAAALIAMTLTRSSLGLTLLVNLSLLFAVAVFRVPKIIAILALTSISVLLLFTFMQTNGAVITTDRCAPLCIVSPDVVAVEAGDDSFSLQTTVEVVTSGLETLSNRGSLFAVSVRGISDNLWTGVGYVSGVRSYIAGFYSDQHWLPPHTHNAYLEAMLGMGVAGVIVIFLALFASFVAFLMFIRCESTAEDRVIALIVPVVIAVGLIEVPLAQRFVFLTGALYLSVLYLWRSLNEPTGQNCKSMK